MRAIQLPALVKGPSELRVATLPDFQPHPSKYLVKLHAAAANFFDNLQIQGKHQQKPPLPFIAGNEFSGEIVAVPTATRDDGKQWRFKRGDRVFGAGLGAFATQFVASEADLRPVPSGWSYLEACSLFYTAPTAYAALILRAQAKKGDYVLVHAAGGGVGLAAVTIAKALGMYVIASADTDKKRQVAKSFGAHFVVDAKGDWAEQAKQCTPDRRGVDVVLDPLGAIDRSLKCIRWGGRLVVIGFAAGEIEKIATNRILLKNVAVSGLFWGMYATMEPESVVDVWDNLLKMIEKGGIKPLNYTEKDFQGLEEIPAALELLSTGTAWGKIVIDISKQGKTKL
ncbi:hypothetical protein A1O7_09027 [Cladophialophora yegresii CBS 114405]|uniref:Enoyl reductase (ER) domain-containing protein n=1 Tax=Cladophialophora yegresii CBS 114405 TaxID=1182544 RepID=W9VV91_9EURO|nr:uncharacterized protein A1O7_09027 [Cladophialophora yegresii CBS 114405]EXJ56096.1 hypothetical protein A1O7_09027 [Cladophialophora yegresii CBS 114405]